MDASDDITGRMWREGDRQDVGAMTRRQGLEMDHWRSNPSLGAFMEPYFARMAEACVAVCKQLIATRDRVGATTDDKLSAQGLPAEFTQEYADQVRAFTKKRRIFNLIRGLDNVFQSRTPGIRIGSAVDAGNPEVTYSNHPDGGYIIRETQGKEFFVELYPNMKEKSFSPDQKISIPAHLVAHILPLDPSHPAPDVWFNTEYYADGTPSPYADAKGDDGSAVMESIVEVPFNMPY